MRGATSSDTSGRKCAPSVTCRSRNTSGSQAWSTGSSARISGESAFIQSRFRFRFRALVRQPWERGPFWLGRWCGEECSCPSTLKMGTKTKVRWRRRPGSAVPSRSSRRSWKPASLPSISPGWIPARAKTTGRPRRRAFSGVSVPSSLAASAQRGRPSPVVPKRSARSRPRKRRVKARTSVSTSEAGPVSEYPESSAWVSRGRGVVRAIGPRSLDENRPTAGAQVEGRLRAAATSAFAPALRRIRSGSHRSR